MFLSYDFFQFFFSWSSTFLSSNGLMAEEKQNVTIACNATGQPQPSITWSKAFGSLPKHKAAVKNGALTIYHVAKNDGDIYMCKAENILGRTTSTVLVVVFFSLRFKVRPPHEMTPLSGFNVRLPCLAESDLKPAVSWKKEGKLYFPLTPMFSQMEHCFSETSSNHTKELTSVEQLML